LLKKPAANVQLEPFAVSLEFHLHRPFMEILQRPAY